MAPQIKDYTAENTVLRPTETGIDALSQVGRRAGGFYNQAAEAIKGSADAQARAAGAKANAAEDVARSYSGIAKSVVSAGDQAVAYVEHQEISHGAASFAQLHSDLTDQWNDTAKNADPNDTSIAGKFRETQLEPALEQFTGSFSTAKGQEWAESHAAALRQHLFEKQSADMATLAGDAVTVNVRKTTNAWSNTARNDPSSVPFLLQTADASIGGIVDSSPNLKGTDAAKVRSQVTQKAKEDIVRAGALGAIERAGDPVAAADAFSKRYPDYINGPEIGQLARAAQAQNKANAFYQKQTESYQHTQNVRAADTAATKAYTDNIVVGDDGRLTLKPQFFKDALAISKMPDAPTHLTPSLFTLGRQIQEQKTDPVTDEPTRNALTQRLLDPQNPTTIYDVMREKGKLSDRDFTRLESAVKLAQEAPIQEPIFKATMHGAVMLFGTDPIGESKHAQFMQAFLPQYLQQYRAGTLPPNALDLNDEKSMISQAMKPYIRNFPQQMMDRTTHGGGLDFPGGENGPTVPRAAPGGFVNVPPTLKTDGEIMSWAKQQGYPAGTVLKRADGKTKALP